MDEVTTRNRAAYDRIAADFAARNPAVAATYRALAGEFQDRLDGPLLDLGCGPGRDLAFWVERGAGFTPLRLITDVSDTGQRWLCHLTGAA